MAFKKTAHADNVKLPTGISGLDAMTDGGLPGHSATIIVGPAGAGKTIFALQILTRAAGDRGQPGIFVAFEESVDKIVDHASSFGWDLSRLQRRNLFFIDARLPEEAVQSGDFEITGLLASIGARARKMKARWVVFDSIDVLIDLLPDVNLRMREIRRLQKWLAESNLTCIITTKSEAFVPGAVAAHTYLAYMVDCVIVLDPTHHAGTLTRSLIVQKYRGSAHIENAVPFLIGTHGIEINPLRHHTNDYRIYTQRLSTGIPRLDSMLEGGLLRGSATLVTGAPGTSKTTLAGKFAEAACKRGERALYICFDEAGKEIVRNLRSVNIHLGPFVKNGLLRTQGIVSRARNAEAQIAEILASLTDYNPHVLIVDPLSALAQQGAESGVIDVAYRLVQHCKMRGISLYATSLVDKMTPETESTEINVSTLADTWIHLNYLVRSGERNRALTVVKSRGTGHSDQVRELILTHKGVTLADVFIEEGEVLMGTLRDQREVAANRTREQEAESRAHERLKKEQAINDLASIIRTQQRELDRLVRELAIDTHAGARTIAQGSAQRARTSRRRAADKPITDRKPR